MVGDESLCADTAVLGADVHLSEPAELVEHGHVGRSASTKDIFGLATYLPELAAKIEQRSDSHSAAHEQQTLAAVVDARSKATSMNVDADDLTPERLAAFQQAQEGVRSALGRLIAVAENYPDLKANQNFLQLQEEISDLENKLAAVRRYFNSATKELNNAVETFPSNLIAGTFGFKKEMMFDLGEQRATLEEAPKIKF